MIQRKCVSGSVFIEWEKCGFYENKKHFRIQYFIWLKEKRESKRKNEFVRESLFIIVLS